MSITKEQIEQAHERIKPFIHKTPVLTSQNAEPKFQEQIYFLSVRIFNRSAPLNYVAE